MGNFVTKKDDIKDDNKIWGWVGFATDMFSTYGTVPYKEYTDIISDFKDIKVKKDLNKIKTDNWHSPTGCYFTHNKTYNTNCFYIDSQGCVVWYIDDSDNSIYCGDSNDRLYVAKSLPEFLSRVYNENKKWYIDNNFKINITWDY